MIASTVIASTACDVDAAEGADAAVGVVAAAGVDGNSGPNRPGIDFREYLC